MLEKCRVFLLAYPDNPVGRVFLNTFLEHGVPVTGIIIEEKKGKKNWDRLKKKIHKDGFFTAVRRMLQVYILKLTKQNIACLGEKHGIDVVIPSKDERQVDHDVIISELTNGIIKDSSRQKYVDIIKNLADAGAEAVVLGCTEIPLLVKQEHCSMPLIDTTTIHSLAAVDFALK